MSDTLVNLVNAIDQDPILLQEYNEKPQQTCERFGISADDMALLIANEPEALKKRLEMTGINATIKINHSY